MQKNDDLKCESMHWRRPGKKMGRKFDFHQWEVDHRDSIFKLCLAVVVLGVMVVAFLSGDRIGVIRW